MEKAIRVFEEHSHFNAGRGSCLNESGEVECDAVIIDGHTMKSGAMKSSVLTNSRQKIRNIPALIALV